MSYYPVAYRSAEAVAKAGFQSLGAESFGALLSELGPVLSTAGPLAAFLLGWDLGNRLFDFLHPPEKGPLPDGFGEVLAVKGSSTANMTGYTWSCFLAGTPDAANCFLNTARVGIHGICGGDMRQTCAQLGGSSTFGAGETVYGIGGGAYPAGVVTVIGHPVTPSDVPFVDKPGVALDTRAGAVAGAIDPGVYDTPAVPYPVPGVYVPSVDVPVDGFPDEGSVIGVNDLPGVLEQLVRQRPGTRVIVSRDVASGVVSISVPVDPLRFIDRPPPPTKERKRRGRFSRYNSFGLLTFANAITEGRDFIEALWKALPRKYKTKEVGPKGHHAKTRVNTMLTDLVRAFADGVWSDEYAHEAVKNVLANEMQDAFYGGGGRAYRAAVNRLADQGYYNSEHGLQTGDRYRPRVSNRDRVDPFEWVASKIVDSVW